MSTRPPHPPSPNGRVADLWRRARLTLKYHGPKELAFRIVTAPLRPTPLGERLGHGGATVPTRRGRAGGTGPKVDS